VLFCFFFKKVIQSLHVKINIEIKNVSKSLIHFDHQEQTISTLIEDGSWVHKRNET